VDVLTCAGELDMAAADVLRAALEHADGRSLVVDLRDVSFIDSTGLAALLSVRERYAENGVSVCRPSGAARRMLEISGLDDLFLIRESLAEAAAAVGLAVPGS
jgi:anti-anti-sigma factor